MQSHIFRCALLALPLLSLPANAATLNLIRGTETHLNGSLGDVQVNYLVDNISLSDYIDSGGLQTGMAPIPTARIQYDLLNNAGNGSIFNFRVDYAAGTTLIGAAMPNGFYQSDGSQLNYWGGSYGPYAILFDSGFGSYSYGEWLIEYQPDHVVWQQMGNGFFPDTATGDTNHGFVPAFSLYFQPGTPLGLQPGEVSGWDTAGNTVLANGRVLSAVPVPAAFWLLTSGLLALVGLARRQRH